MPVKVVLWTAYKNKAGACAIKIKVSAGNREKYFPVGAAVSASDWNAKAGRVKPGHKHAVEINSKIVDLLGDYEKRLMAGDIFGVTTSKDVYWWFEARISQSLIKDGPNNARKLTTALNKFKEYRANLPVKDFNYSFLRGFEMWMLGQKKSGGKPYHTNYIADCFKRLRIIATEMENAGVIPVHKNPFRTFKIEFIDTEPKRLTLEQIQKIEAYRPKFAGVKMAKDMYLFSFYCYGIRFGDLCRLKKSNIVDGRLHYTMNKSKKNKRPTVRSIRLNQKALEIIKRHKGKGYLFKLGMENHTETEVKFYAAISSRNNFYNKKLAVLCRAVKVPVVTFHTARNTVADLVIEKGLTTRDAMELLGHQNEATTKIYLKKQYTEKTDEAGRKIFGD